jgi:sugar lactone lactonase YvrE
MTRYGLGAACGLAATMSLACGSGTLTIGPLDASTDAGTDAGTDDAGTITMSCGNAQLLGGCGAGSCMVSAPTSPLPAGASMTLTQTPAPDGLAGDALGSVVCTLGLPTGVASLANLDLRISLPTAPDSSATLFQYVSSSLSRIVLTSQSAASAVEGLVTAPGTFGATERPALWSLSGDIGLNLSSAADQASLLRDVSGLPMFGSYYDGTHLFVCNGSRLLVYNGIPAAPGIAPALVIGQPDIDTISGSTSSSLFGHGACTAPWSDGHRLVVLNQNRVLVWNTIPTAPLTPADLVLGQSDFASNGTNSGGVSATTLNNTQGVDSDGTRLAVADMGNNRILIWNTFPVAVDQPPDFVVGQPDFTTNTINAGAAPMYEAFGVALQPGGMFVSSLFGPPFGLAHIAAVTANNPAADYVALVSGTNLDPATAIPEAGNVIMTPAGGLAVRDAFMQRVGLFRSIPSGPAAIDFVLGQPDTVHIVESPVNSSSLSVGETLGAGKTVLVPDNNRLLVFDTSPIYNYEPASRVVGQPGFTTNGPVDYRGISASTLAGPTDVSAAGGMVAVADRSNNRVVLFRASDATTPNASAAVVLGQADAQSYVPNLDQQTPSAGRMSGPSGVALDGAHLIVADTENHRVLIWKTVPTTTGTPADLELGQADFTGRRPNRGRGDANLDGFSDADSDGFFYPMGVASDGVHLFVADQLNNRVLSWNTFPTANGQRADAVIGQADFKGSQPNAGNGPFVFVGQGLNLPTGLALSNGSLWIADGANNRVVRWDSVATTPAPAAVFLGQTSGSSVTNAHYFLTGEGAVGEPRGPQTTSAGSVLGPRGLAVVGTTLYVTELDSNRVHMFDTGSLASLGELGQTSDSGAAANSNGVTGVSLSGPVGIAAAGTILWVADANNNRVLGYNATTPLVTGAAASEVLGQPSLLTNGFNQTSAAADGATAQPSGVALASGNLYVADTSNNRVLVMKTPVLSGQPATQVYGQPNGTLALPNAGGSPTASTLRNPKGVFADASHLVVADTGNNRVLVYDPTATGNAAFLVVGQANFTANAANGGGPSSATMQGPTAAYSDGTSLWVSDTGNHRVLFWKTFPTVNGQPADLEVGQPSFTTVLPNQGLGAASAGSLAFPSGIVVVGGALYVADTGNNRVVSFSSPPVVSAASADGVLGQTDLVSRTAAATASDLAHMSGPAALTSDGENLYVVDRDLGRVLVYGVGTVMSSSPALLDIGAPTGVALNAPQGIAVERTAFFTSQLYVADTGDNQVAVVASVSRLAPE